MENLEDLLLPSRWSKRLPPDIIVDKHVEITTKLSGEIRKCIPNELNVPYGRLDKEKFDIFGTDLKPDSPIFVFIHGGYWQEQLLQRSNYHFIAKNLHKNGIKSIFIGYELCPKVSLSKILEEIQVALKKCFEYARQHKSKGLNLCGHSAGAHLLSMLFTKFFNTLDRQDQDLVKSVMLLGGIYDLIQIPATSINIPLKLTDNDAINLSPMRLAICDDLKMKFLVVAADEDSPEFRKQSEDFAAKLTNLGMNVELFIMTKVDHFNLIELLIDEDYELSRKILEIILTVL